MSQQIQYSLTVLTKDIEENSRKLEISLIRIAGYLERLTGDANLKRFINTVQSAIVAVRTLQIMIRALELASGPVGWLYAGTTIVAAGMSGYSIYESITGV